MFLAGALGYRHREVSELLCDRGCSRAGPRHEQVHLAPPHRQRPGQSLQFSLVGCTKQHLNLILTTRVRILFESLEKCKSNADASGCPLRKKVTLKLHETFC